MKHHRLVNRERERERKWWSNYYFLVNKVVKN